MARHRGFVARSRTTWSVLGIGVCCLSLAAAGAPGIPAASAATGTFAQTSATTIVDGTIAAPYASEIVVSGLPKGVFQVQPTLTGFSHESPDDVDVFLVAPYGGRNTFLSDVGGSTPVTGLDLTFSDSAPSKLPDGGTLVSGSFLPSNPEPFDPFPAPAPDPSQMTADQLSWSFQFGDPNGVWRLYVVDDVDNDKAGSISGWSLTLRTADVPDTPVIDVPATGSADGDGNVTLSGFVPGIAPITTVTVHENSSVIATPNLLNNRWTTVLNGLSDGPHTFTSQATDFYGNITAFSAPVTVTVDRVSPMARLVISSYRGRVSDRTVTLAVIADDPAPSSGVTQMRLSSNGTTYGTWEPVVPSRRFTLRSGPDGPRRVWLQVRDLAGHQSAAATATAVLDTTRPMVVRTRPARRSEGVDRGQNITAKFSEAVLRSTLTATQVRLFRSDRVNQVRATIRYRPNRHLVVIDPRRDLAPGTTYQVVLTTGIRDLAGNRLGSKAQPGAQRVMWLFRTR